jgi:kynurenine formamidase
MDEPHSGIERSEKEFRELFKRVSNWGRWGPDDELGTLNHLTPARVAGAVQLVERGECVSLSRPLDTQASLDNPEPADHHMTMLSDEDIGSGTLRFAKDYVGVDYHNDTHSHLDALSHVAFDGAIYNGVPAEKVDADGASAGSVELLKDGLVGRGVLLDIPRVRGVDWLEPGEEVAPDDLAAAESSQKSSSGEGDILLIRTGHGRRLDELGPWDTASAKAGLRPDCAVYIRDRLVAALGSDGNSDTAPSTTEGIDFPIHALTLNAMGMPLLDYLHLDDLAAACQEAGRWEFLFVAVPLRIAGGTGSPLNPIAIL